MNEFESVSGVKDFEGLGSRLWLSAGRDVTCSMLTSEQNQRFIESCTGRRVPIKRSRVVNKQIIDDNKQRRSLGGFKMSQRTRRFVSSCVFTGTRAAIMQSIILNLINVIIDGSERY